MFEDLGKAVMENIANVLTAAIGIHFITRYFMPKFTGKKMYLCMFLGGAAYFAVLSFINLLVPFEGVWGVIYAMVLFGYSYLALEGDAGDKIIASALWVFIVLISTLGAFSVIRLITKTEFQELIKANGYARFYSLSAITLLKLALGKAILMIRKGERIAMKKKENIEVVALYFLLATMIIAIFWMELYAGTAEGRHYMLIFLLIGFSGVILWVYFYCRRISRFEQKILNYQYMQEALRLETEYVKDFTKVHHEMHILRHDMKGHIENMGMMLEAGQNEEARDYIRAIAGRLDKYPALLKLTGNQGLNAALTKCVQACTENGIDFTYTVAGPVEHIDSADLGILFYNLFNNAVEACEKITGDRAIQMEIKPEGSYLRCTVKNSIEESVLDKNPGLLSSKKDKSLHGYGTKSIGQIVEKYDGMCVRREEGRFFVQVLLLKCEI